MNLKDLYTYHPPTPETTPRYKALNVAFVAARGIVSGTLIEAAAAVEYGGEVDSSTHSRISAALLTAAEIVNEHAPDCRDRDLAQDALREARMWANKAVVCLTELQSAARYESLYRTEMERAQMWANSAVANYTVPA